MMCDPLHWQDNRATSSLLPEMKNVHIQKWNNGLKSNCYRNAHLYTAALFQMEEDKLQFPWTTRWSRVEIPVMPKFNERHYFLSDFSPNLPFEVHNNSVNAQKAASLSSDQLAGGKIQNMKHYQWKL